ncbi:MAG: GDYXXLXY domain-containing protein [Cytophagaceae bacterium]
MKNKLVKTILFFVIMGLYLFVPFYLISTYTDILKNGKVYRFKPRPVDPYDAFRGKYITLYFLQTSITYDTTKMDFKKGDNVYLKLEKDSAGYGIFTQAFKSAPENSDYIKTMVRYEWKKSGDPEAEITFDLPFDRYYLPEDMAPQAEQLYFENLRMRGENTDSVYVDVRIKDGKALIEELYFQGIPVKEFIHKHQAD